MVPLDLGFPPITPSSFISGHPPPPRATLPPPSPSSSTPATPPSSLSSPPPSIPPASTPSRHRPPPPWPPRHRVDPPLPPFPDLVLISLPCSLSFGHRHHHSSSLPPPCPATTAPSPIHLQATLFLSSFSPDLGNPSKSTPPQSLSLLPSRPITTDLSFPQIRAPPQILPPILTHQQPSMTVPLPSYPSSSLLSSAKAISIPF